VSEKIKKGAWVWLGRLDYRPAMRLMNSITSKVEQGEPGCLMLLEHSPVITLGHRETGANIILPEEELQKRGIEVERADRGGLATYHGPGQLVGYLVFRLADLAGTIHELTYKLEGILIRLAASMDVHAARRKGLPGVWVKGDKLASIGMRVRKGIVGHGFSFNLHPNMKNFEYIISCGIQGAGAVSIESVSGSTPRVEEAAHRVIHLFQESFGILLERDNKRRALDEI